MAGKEKIVQFRVSEEEFVELTKAAADAGWTMSQYCRRKVLPNGLGVPVEGDVSDPDHERELEAIDREMQEAAKRRGKEYLTGKGLFVPAKGCKSPEKCARKGASCDVCRAG